VNAALARLALRRALPGGAWLAGVAAAALVARAAWQPDALVAQALGAEGDAAALARAGAWTALLALYGAWLVGAAAALPARWRAGEVQWLARATAPTFARALSAWLGLAAAGALALGAIAVAGELAARRGPERPAHELVARFEAPDAALAPGAAPLRVALDLGDARAGDRLRVRLADLGGGPTARVRAALEGSGAHAEALLGAAGQLELELSPTPQPGLLTLEHLEGEAVLVVAAGGIEIVRPLGTPAAPARRVAARAALALAAWLALALGLGAWMAPALAWLLSAGAALVCATSPGPWLRVLPLARLPEALGRLGQGTTGPWPGADEVAAAVGLTLAGLGLAAAGLRRWRSAAR
jgi:hypothetical protein